MMSERSRFPFTAAQWQELEHQALIFKYMVSGMPIPPDLLFSIKSNMDLSLSPQHYGWNILQMGLGRKVDPEPGRCRRTDGKKWRCSKEAYIDSKYCERHMHRGKNRSRKHVENNNFTTTEYKNPSPILKNNPPSSFMFQSNNNNHPFQYSHHSSSRSNHGLGLSFQDDDSHRYDHGVKEELGEHSFFSGASRTMRSFSESASSLTLNNSTTSSKQSDYSSAYLGLENFTDTQNQHKQDQNSCLLGNDDEPLKTVHRFFDEWPRNLDDDDGDSSKYCSSLSNTQLSISVPSSSHLFPVFNSRTNYW